MKRKVLWIGIVVAFTSLTLLCILFMHAKFFMKSPFEAAATKAVSWSPEVQQFIENEIEMSFPSQFSLKTFRYEKFLDYNIFLVFTASKGDFVKMLPDSAQKALREYTSLKEVFDLPSNDPPLNTAIANGKSFLVAKHYPIMKSDRKPPILNLCVILPKLYSETEESEEVTVIMTIYET